jgi:OFA family oxalate/formate antiporter-like MFS transporter
MLYLAAALSGIGAGGIYATCVGNAVKWFPDRRGLAVGLTAAGFGAGAAVTVIPIQMLIAARGYEATFLIFAIVQGVVVFLLSWLLRPPLPGEVPALASPKLQQARRSSTPREVVESPIFWLLYVMFVAVSASGLMATAQIAVIARSYGIADNVFLLGATTLTVALIVDSVMNGLARPFFGWISDRIGREYTMAIAFGLGGGAYWLLGELGTTPFAFVLLAGLIFFTWGEIFSLFPLTCTDTFGPKYATANASLLYTAKGMSAFLVPLANVFQDLTGGWQGIFTVAALVNFAVVALALFVLKPMRSAALAGSSSGAGRRSEPHPQRRCTHIHSPGRSRTQPSKQPWMRAVVARTLSSREARSRIGARTRQSKRKCERGSRSVRTARIGRSWATESSAGNGVEGAGLPKNGTSMPRASLRSDIMATVTPWRISLMKRRGVSRDFVRSAAG